MNRKRIVKTAINLLLSVLLVIGTWSGIRKPLPWKWEYRRMERAMLLEPMEIVYHGEEGEVLSVDEKQLALYTGDWFGFPMWNNMIYVSPLENGFGRIVRKEIYFEMDIWAYDASGQAVQADMELTVWDNEHDPAIIRESAQLADGFFAFCIHQSKFEDTWMDRALQTMVAAEIHTRFGFEGAEEYESGYNMVLTFYDETGNIVGTHESGGEYSYEN